MTQKTTDFACRKSYSEGFSITRYPWCLTFDIFGHKYDWQLAVARLAKSEASCSGVEGRRTEMALGQCRFHRRSMPTAHIQWASGGTIKGPERHRVHLRWHHEWISRRDASRNPFGDWARLIYVLMLGHGDRLEMAHYEEYDNPSVRLAVFVFVLQAPY